MLLTAIIVDDEANNRENLHYLLTQNCPYVNVLSMAGTADEAIQEILHRKPNLLFLDIRMPGGDGFKVLEEIKNQHFEVIFVTAYNQYALKAIKFSALDYILKPIDEQELIKAVEKGRQKMTYQNENLKLKLFLDNYRLPKDEKRLALPTQDKIEFIKTSDITYCKGENNYTTFCLKSQKQLVISKTLKEYELLLSDMGFFRIHRSYLVNLAEIQSYVKTGGGSVLLKDGTTLVVSKNRKEGLLSMLKE